MSEATPTPSSFVPETTFRSFNKEQGKNYAQNRGQYHHKLYEILMDRHMSTGGELNTIIDVGCGPGIAVRTLAPHFVHAIGLDPSEGMISEAQSLGGISSNAEAIRFEVSSAEELGSNLSPPIADSSVDLITAATAAHWFNMSGFWPRAAQILKPGGSVAIWTTGSLRVHPSMPNAVAIQAAVDEYEELLKDFFIEGNRITRDLYTNLALPWTLSPPVKEFEEATFLRKEWGTDDKSEPSEEFLAHQEPVDLNRLEKILGTSSPVIRWREANPDKVGTELDVVRIIRNNIERLLHEAGVEKGKEMLRGGVKGVLLVVKRK